MLFSQAGEGLARHLRALLWNGHCRRTCPCCRVFVRVNVANVVSLAFAICACLMRAVLGQILQPSS